MTKSSIIISIYKYIQQILTHTKGKLTVTQ